MYVKYSLDFSDVRLKGYIYDKFLSFRCYFFGWVIVFFYYFIVVKLIVYEFLLYSFGGKFGFELILNYGF